MLTSVLIGWPVHEQISPGTSDWEVKYICQRRFVCRWSLRVSSWYGFVRLPNNIFSYLNPIDKQTSVSPVCTATLVDQMREKETRSYSKARDRAANLHQSCYDLIVWTLDKAPSFVASTVQVTHSVPTDSLGSAALRDPYARFAFGHFGAYKTLHRLEGCITEHAPTFTHGILRSISTHPSCTIVHVIWPRGMWASDSLCKKASINYAHFQSTRFLFFSLVVIKGAVCLTDCPGTAFIFVFGRKRVYWCDPLLLSR